MRAHLALPPLRAHAAAALLRRGALGPVRPRGHLAVIHYNKEEVTRAVNDHSRSGDSLLALLYAMLNGVEVETNTVSTCEIRPSQGWRLFVDSSSEDTNIASSSSSSLAQLAHIE